MRKKILLAFLMLCLGSFTVAAGCNEIPDSEPEQIVAETLLSKESITLDINQEYWLTLEYDGSEKIEWSVADSSIVTVEEGKLTGLKEGTTTVTVKVGDDSDSCSVTVLGYKPEKLTLELSRTNVSLYINEEMQISGTVKYDGNVITPMATKNYESTNPEIVSVDSNGKVTAKAYGNATISVTYTIGGVELTASVNVSVVSGGKVEIIQSSVELDVSEENKTTTLTAKAYENGVENTNATISWSVANEDVATISGGVLTAQNAGETTVTATYVDNDGKTKTDTITVTVLPIRQDSNNSIVLSKDEYKNGYLVDAESLIGEAVTVTGGYVISSDGLKTQLPFANSRYDFSAISAGEKELYVQTRNVEYKVDLELWTATISDATELEQLLTATNGWYKLDQDIVLDSWQYSDEVEFKGVFDGQGHEITFTSRTGLFDVLAGNAIVKNVTLNTTIRYGGSIAETVKAGASVTVENITVYADVWGTENGGLIADVAGNLTLKNVTGLVSKANNSNTNGALFGVVSTMPELENVSVYSSLTLCGQSAKNNSQAEVLNALTDVVVSPIVSDENEKVMYIQEAGKDGKEIALANGAYVSYTVYGNSVREVVGETNGTAVITMADVVDRASVGERIGGSVDVLFKKADGSVDYCSMVLDYTIYINNSNFATYFKNSSASAAPKEGYYQLIEDITLTSNWTNYGVFAGCLDGDGHTISGLAITKANTGKKQGGGLFYQMQNATVKNLIITDVRLGNLASVFAYQILEGTITFENVYVSLASQFFSEGTDIGDDVVVDASNRYKSGLITNHKTAGSAIVVKNSTIYIPQHLAQASGFVAGTATAAVTVSGCTFIGGNGSIVGSGSTTVVTQENTVITDAVSAHKVINAKEESERSFIEKAYQANHPYVELNGANFVETFSSMNLKSILVLTEDIDFAAAEGEEGYVVNGADFLTGSTLHVFQGVFDGQNHAIKNMIVNQQVNNTGVLFKDFAGGLKNIAFINCGVVYAGTKTTNFGIICDTVYEKSTAYFENVYMEVSNITGAGGTIISPICRKMDGALSMKNVVIYCYEEVEEVTSFIGLLTTTVTTVIMENCHYVNEKSVTLVNTTSTSYQQNAANIRKFFFDSEISDDGLTSYTTYDDFYASQYENLSEAMQGWLSEPTEE